MSFIEPLSEVRKGHIRQVLAHTRGDLTLACRILGVSQEELGELLSAYGLERPPGPDPTFPTPKEE